MTVKIKVRKLKLSLWLPTCFAGGIALSCAKRELKKSGFKLKKSRKLKRDILRAIKKTKKKVGKFELVNVSTHDGVKVVIKI
ncbi:MAG: hypothetical protein K2O89_04510 [Clostridia bacterium]|nr:hypothetical protein [Clostridia bacterium]